ncbi:DNA cytosine methyltransferase [Candidatus Electronema sp. JM]|uniref:DNA cytosine methyltransferase n=1 Tax=Candidatus Electronema sp. JM TaxID=3401571 RepID=UPI003AA879E9
MRCVDIFSGCGGLSLGFQNAGYDVVAAFDNWEKAVAVYQKNFSHPVFLHDLNDEDSSIRKIEQFHPEMIMGGPPCQDFSSAGKRDTSQGRADLTFKFANIVCAVKPKWFVMENVERIKKSNILSEIIEQLQCAGYGLTSAVLDASFCGVPQARKRFFLIGQLGGRHNALTNIMQKNLSAQPMTVREYLGDSLGVEYYYRHPRNYNRRGIFSIDEPSPTVRGVNRPVPKGYKLNACDPAGVSLDTIRPLTTIERSYIQTFPKSFQFSGTQTDLEQMIGNAVPVKLAEFVAKCMTEHIRTGGVRTSLFDGVLPFKLHDKPLRRCLHFGTGGLV